MPWRASRGGRAGAQGQGWDVGFGLLRNQRGLRLILGAAESPQWYLLIFIFFSPERFLVGMRGDVRGRKSPDLDMARLGDLSDITVDMLRWWSSPRGDERVGHTI